MERNLPQHVAIIMDGNGRWAKEKNKIRLEGHKKGAKRIEDILAHSAKLGIKYLTVYAFSTENWKRPEEEVKGLMDLFYHYLSNQKKKLKKEDIRLIVMGSKKNIPKKLSQKIEEVENYLSNCKTCTFTIAFNYGGRQEIIDGINKLLQDGKTSIDEETFHDYLYQPSIPDPDLVIRTSGEFRISNFLLWQIAYSEFYITNVYWPDFTTEKYDEALASYINRERRYGGIDVK